MGLRSRGRPPHPDVLTPAERNVLGYVREGLTNAEIAVRLGISPDGVKYHVSNMLAKSGARDRHELAKWKPRPGGTIRPHLLLAAVYGIGVVVVAGGIVAAMALLAADDESDGVLPDVVATREVESFVIERTSMIRPEHYGIPIAGERQNHEWISAAAPDRTRTEETGEDGSFVIVHIGNEATVWTDGPYQVVTRRTLPFALPPNPRTGWPGGGSTLEEVVSMRMSVWRAELVGMGALTGRNVYLVEGEPAECAGFNGGRIELAIDTETLFVLRHAVYAFETDELVRLDEVISVEYDVALDDSVFAPPPERQIEDVSDRGSGRVFMGHDGDEADCY